MSPPRRPHGPRSSGPGNGPQSGPHAGPGFGPSARSASGQPPRPRAFDGKRGWSGNEPPAEARGGRPPFPKPGAGPAGGPSPSGKPWAKPPGKSWSRPPGDARPGRSGPEAEAPRGPRPPRTAEAPRRDAAEDRAPANTFWMHGLHAVGAALLNPKRRLRRLLLTAEAETALSARLPPGTFAARKLSVERVEDRVRFHSFLPEDAVHQGAAMLVEPLPGVGLEDVLEASTGPVLLLDQVTDPRNVGAILRSAAAFGAAAVVVQDRHAPPETGALARAASGALELVPMVREVNLARAIRGMQDRGIWVLGLAGEATRTLAEAKPADRRVGLVLGAEAGGLRRLQRETVDEMVRLPIAGDVESLNVAAAAAVALYELARA
ncbi:TrmH family RNA methyltransferase [Muricoccus aerilatus]|uniref:TrmH family RNA methyltransferase n=1 Tax=Muricoccus aerilatus TaxID=452982 RepID=UPI0009FF8F1A